MFVLGCSDPAQQTERFQAMVEFVKNLSPGKRPNAVVLSGGGKNSLTTEAKQMKSCLDQDGQWDVPCVLLEEDSLDTGS
ncbi:MAG: hypothetical protein ACREXS_03560 [Gammaproteobacteria bacterium]